MPMPISNLDEYDKVVNVSWFTPDKPRDELSYALSPTFEVHSDTFQISMRFAFLTNVSTLLHRHSKFFKPVLLLLR
jgi:DUF438 domain-containing protein